MPTSRARASRRRRRPRAGALGARRVHTSRVRRARVAASTPDHEERRSPAAPDAATGLRRRLQRRRHPRGRHAPRSSTRRSPPAARPPRSGPPVPGRRRGLADRTPTRRAARPPGRRRRAAAAGLNVRARPHERACSAGGAERHGEPARPPLDGARRAAEAARRSGGRARGRGARAARAAARAAVAPPSKEPARSASSRPP